MKAMIFAAGLGTRLEPLTNNKPKALVEVNGMTLLEIIIKRLKSFGFDEIIINVHHFANQIIHFLNHNDNFNTRIEVSDESAQLLDTGGGLKKASWFFDDNKPFLVHNVDVLSDINLDDLYKTHLSTKALATLAVRNRKTSRYLVFDSSDNLCGWKNITTGEKITSRQPDGETALLAFSGIHIINPRLFTRITQEGKFSIIHTYLQLADQYPIKAYQHDNTKWIDVGKPETINTNLSGYVN